MSMTSDVFLLVATEIVAVRVLVVSITNSLMLLLFAKRKEKHSSCYNIRMGIAISLASLTVFTASTLSV